MVGKGCLLLAVKYIIKLTGILALAQEYQLVKRRIPNGLPTRLIYRTIYVVIVGFVAITLVRISLSNPTHIRPLLSSMLYTCSLSSAISWASSVPSELDPPRSGKKKTGCTTTVRKIY